MSLEKLYKELNTLKWGSESMDWNLAIEAVCTRINEMRKSIKSTTKLLKIVQNVQGKDHYMFIVKIFMKGVASILIIKYIKIME